MRQATAALRLIALVLMFGCDSAKSTDVSPSEFVVRGSSRRVAPVGRIQKVDPDIALAFRPVNADLFRVSFFEMRVSANVNCAAPFVTIFSGTTALVRDMTTDPVIARVTGITAGTYPCVALRVSDQLTFSPATTETTCAAATTYLQDFYRVGNELVAFRDIDGVVIPATGTRAAPSEDRVWVFFSTNPATVIARGYSPSQTNPLAGALVAPGTTTFFWSAENSVQQDGAGGCEIIPSSVGFR